MLRMMRQNLKRLRWILYFVAFSFVAAIFFVWGEASKYADEGEKTNVFVKIGDSDFITWEDYYRTRRNIENRYRQQFKENFAQYKKYFNFDEMAEDQLVSQKLLLLAAADMGVQVTKKQLSQMIIGEPSFQIQGKFNKVRYIEVLAMNELSPPVFEYMERERIASSKAVDLIQSMAKVSRAEAHRGFIQKNEKAEIKFVRVERNKETKSPDENAEEFVPTEEEIERRFEENQSEYVIPEKRKVAYIYVAKADIQKEAENSVTDEQVEDEYLSNRDKYKQGEQVKASHILFKVDKDASEKEELIVKEKAEKALERARSGEDFAAMAKELSEDASNAGKGGDLGYFEKGRMVPNFETAAWEAEPGTITDLVRTRFGYHIILVEDKKPERIQELAEAKDKIRKDLERKRTDSLLGIEIDSIRNSLEEKLIDLPEVTVENITKAYADLAEEQKKESGGGAGYAGLKQGITGFFAKDESRVEGIPFAQNFSKTAFETELFEIGEPISGYNGQFVITPLSVEYSRPAQLEDVREDVIADWRRTKEENALHELAETILEELESGKSWDDIAEDFDLEVKEPDSFTREGGTPGFPRSPEALSTVFTAQSGAFDILEERKQYYIFEKIKGIAADETEFETSFDTLRDEMLAKKRQDVYKTYLENMKRKLGIQKIER